MIIYGTKKMKTLKEKRHFIQNMKYLFPKIRLQLANTDTVLGRSHVCIIIQKKFEIGSIVSELNPKL